MSKSGVRPIRRCGLIASKYGTTTPHNYLGLHTGPTVYSTCWLY